MIIVNLDVELAKKKMRSYPSQSLGS